MAFQEANGLAVDGMAGAATLAKMNSFADVVTEAVVQKAEVTVDEEHFDSEDLPEIDGADAVKGSGEAAPEKSVWGKIKGWFS